ncbi:lanthionine synthetase-like protein [Chitinophaga niastensis]|uniref:Lanthionine synthetase-like protein n=1 Tax=Chitinophaga niastensis TaxID=536980 RepID=A0A2P8HVQ3_CHINA|nr:lanthionine synthetase LanC family protein [Chitinophaga niastensis]PSL50296.1 lanthionine synthetase-like protein [Chitinophaga niastensis]
MISDTATASLEAIHIENIRKALEGKEAAIQNASYETGLLGLSLFYCYYAGYTGDESYFSRAEDYLTKGLEVLDLPNFKRIYMSDSLDSHLAHIGRFLEFSKKNKFLDLDIYDYLLGLDDTLSGLMKSKISIGDFDLNSGALAAGYYYLSRLDSNPAVAAHLSALVEGIREQALTDEAGDYYWPSPSLFKRVYLGISHGSALIISFLSNVYERNIATNECRDILNKALRFLLKQQRTQVRGLFPLQLGDAVEPKQFAQCYGDIGVGYALYRAASVLHDEALAGTAMMVLEDCLLRKKEDKLTLDASIIYGASGVAAIFEKLHRLSGDQRFMDAAIYWYKQIATYAVHENEFAGYSTRLVNAGELWDISFGWGITGIGISLMRYVKKELPPIDSLMMIA